MRFSGRLQQNNIIFRSVVYSSHFSKSRYNNGEDSLASCHDEEVKFLLLEYAARVGHKFVLTSTPASSSCCTIAFRIPRSTAKCRGVPPTKFLLSTLAPLSSNNHTVPAFLPATA